ncbi:MAG: hypothetical protein ACE5JA_06020 [bacterium]
MTRSGIGLIIGAQLDELYHDLISKLKSKYGMSEIYAFRVGSNASSLPLRTLGVLDLLTRKYGVVIVLSGYRLRVGDFLRRLLGLLVRAPERRICRPSGDEAELSWGTWLGSLVKYFRLFQKVQTAKFLAYSLSIFCFLALLVGPRSRKE